MPILESHQGTNTDISAYVKQSPQNSAAPLTPISIANLSIPVVTTTPTLPVTAMPGKTIDIRLIPVTPNPQVRQYERHILVYADCTMSMIESARKLATVHGWELLTHPNGALFFYQAYKRVLTDANVRDPDTAVKIDKAIRTVYEGAHNANISLQPSVELALELTVKKGKEYWGYYFVDHEKRVIFWFEDYQPFDLTNNIRGATCKSHVKYAIESQYWRHIELFPNKRVLPEDVVVTLKEFSIYTYAARFMKLTCHTKFENFHGQPGAWLVADQSLYGGRNTHSKYTIITLRILNCILFGSLGTYSNAVHSVWVSGAIVRPRWQGFIEELTAEWSRYAVSSTVMLFVNMRFLALTTQASTVALVHLSALCTIGSLIITLCLVGQVNERLQGRHAISFMVKVSRSIFGLEGLSIMFSLPFALLMWRNFLSRNVRVLLLEFWSISLMQRVGALEESKTVLGTISNHKFVHRSTVHTAFRTSRNTPVSSQWPISKPVGLYQGLYNNISNFPISRKLADPLSFI
ncbi:hypothetical protein BDR04DRAFT_1112518 [Suillus decipiens]|nr:hypothetical protein BDR04DRAFT_1112518 [Suillus decipiens]